MKKILLLGGTSVLIPVIQKAHKMGIHVITADYLPNNIAHKYSDEYYDISVIDKEAVLELARKLEIDGIMSFACDAGVLTAAYVAEKLHLPFQGSYQSNCILQDKGKFRKFLFEHGFNCPRAKSYTNKAEAIKDISLFRWPVMVKPVDSCGSKGVTRVNTPDTLHQAIDTALQKSNSDRFIIEEFIEFAGFHSSADAFTVDGKLEFCTYSDQLFDSKSVNPCTPSYIIWPSTMGQENQEILTCETQRLMNLLGMNTGIYNIETCVGIDGKPYIMEISARGGGCRIAEIQKYATGVDLIELEIKSALGKAIGSIPKPEFNGVWCELVLHNKSDQSAIFEKLSIMSEIKEKYVKEIKLSVKSGEKIEPFTGGNNTFGDLFLHCKSREELNELLNKESQWLHLEGA